jgi:PAS domain S-box-containing protein
MKSKDNAGYLVALTIFLAFSLLVLWEFWLEKIILVDYLEMEVNKSSMDRWTFIVSCISIVCFTLILPLKNMKKNLDEMKSLRTALHGEQALSKVFFSVDNSIILVINNSNKIMQINKKTSYLLGFKEEEMLGQDWISLLIKENNRAELKNRYQQFVNDKNQTFIRFTTIAKTKDGTEKMIDWQCSPLRDENGKIYGSINSGQDITEQIGLRGEISKIKGKYEPYIKKLTTELNFNKKKYHSEAIKSANARARFKFWFELENALMGLSSKQTKKPLEVKNRIKKTLELFGELSNIDHGYVFKFTQSGSHMVNTHLWVSGEPLLEPDTDEEIPLDNFPWFKKKIQKKDIIHISKIGEMPKEAYTEKEMYLSQGIKSLINVPIIHNNSAVGYIGFESNQKEKEWDSDEISIIKAMARLISSITYAPSLQEPQFEFEITPSSKETSVTQPEIDSPPLDSKIISEDPEASKTPDQKPKLSIDKELRKVRESFEKEFQEKIKNMEQAQSKLTSELKEQKEMEANLRVNRDSLQNQLKKKSLELEKLQANADAGNKDEPDMKASPNKSSPEGQLNSPASTTRQAKELEEIRRVLQKKEAELATLQFKLKLKTTGLKTSEIDKFKDTIADKDEEIKSLQKNFKEEKSSKAELENNLSKVQESITKHEKNIEVLETANRVMGAELEELRKVQEECSTHSIQLEDTQQELDNLGIANEQLISDIKEKNYLIEDAKEEIAHYEQMDLPIFILDQDGTIVLWNKTAESLTGYTSDQALNESITFMFAENRSFNFEKDFLAPLKEDSRHQLEIRIQKSDGDEFKSLIRMTSFKDRNGIITTLGYITNLSDLKNEDESQSIKKQFTTLLGDSGLILVTLSPDYLISDINEKAESTFQWDRKQTLEKNFFEMVLSHEDQQKVSSDIQKRINTQASVDLETQAILSDNIKHSFLWNLAQEVDPEDKSVQGFLALGQDITDLRDTQNKLRENEILLNSVVDKAKDGVISIDDNGIIQSFNKGAENLFGYTSDEITGQNVSQLMPAPYSKEHDNYIKSYVEGGISSFIGGPPKEFIGKNRNGSTFPVEITLKEIYKDYQRLFIGIVRDIRKRKEIEIQLAENQEKYHRFLDAESDAILVVNGNTKQILESNPAASQLYGYQPEEFMKLNFKDLVAKSGQWSNGNSPLPNTELGSTQKIPQIHLIKKDGDLIQASLTTSSFHFKDMEYELNIIRDISAEIELEQRLKENHDHFAELLRQSEKHKISLSEEKMNMVDHITSSVVDLVNNPIQGIENILKQVKRQAEMADIHKGLVTVAMNECRRVSDLIGKLKGFQPPTKENLDSLDLHQILDEVIKSNMKTIKDRTISLEKNYAKNLPYIDGIAPQIRQAINNIVKNAEESLIEDEGKIIISTEKDGSNVKIHIKDTGCGISDTDRDRIFDPFFTTKTATHKPGLGLLASMGIVKNHKGDIDVHSEPGEGTTFTVILPLKQSLSKNGGS